MSLVTLGVRNTFRRPLRTGLSVLGVALCLSLILTVAAVSQRYDQLIDQSYSLYGQNAVVVSKASVLVDGVPIGGELPEASLAQLKGVPGVSSLTPMLLVVDFKQLVPVNVTIGVPLQNFSMFAQSIPVQLRGSYPDSADQVVLGNYLAQTSNLTVGSSLLAGNTTLLVSGILSSPNLILASSVMMPLATAQTVEGYGGFVSVVVLGSHTLGAGEVADNVNQDVPGVTAIDPAHSSSLGGPLVSSIGMVGEEIDAFSIVLAALLITVIITANIHDQREELAALRAMGSSIVSVLEITASETLFLALVAVLSGLLLSVISIVAIFQAFASVPVATTFAGILSIIPPVAVVYGALGVACFSTAVGVATTLFLMREED